MRTALALLVLCRATTAEAVKQPTFYARQDYPDNGRARRPICFVAAPCAASLKEEHHDELPDNVPRQGCP